MPGSNAGVQTFVNRELPVGVPGDWAGANIRASIPVGPWAFVAPPSGVSIGGIGWGNPETGICSSYFQPNSFPGFVHRAQQGQALQTAGAAVLANVASLLILSGYPVTPQAQGDFWGLFLGGCSVGNSVYANPTTGALVAGASGASVTATGGAGTISASGALTVTTAPTSGALAVGQIISMAGVPPGTYLASGSGTAWQLANLDGSAIPTVASDTSFTAYGQQAVQWLCMESIPAAASFTATLAAEGGNGPMGLLTVSAVASGTIEVGQWIQSAGATPIALTANCQIIAQISGTAGGVGTYLTSNVPAAVGSGETFTTYQGQMAKISSWAPLG